MTWDLIGHEWAVDVLRQHIKGGATRHAYLFAGAESVGKRTLALRFAQALLCEARGSDGNYCGKCRACERVVSGQHPDVHLVEEEGGLKVDSVRELQRVLALSPFESQRRVAILPEIDTATNSAANALLKTVEEPPGHVVLLLTGTSASAILPTIVSRCEVLSLRPVPYGEIVQGLVGRGVTQEAADLASARSEGLPGVALNLVEDEAEGRRRQRLVEDGLRLVELSRVERFEYVHDLTDDRHLEVNRKASTDALSQWLGLWRDVLHAQHGLEVDPARRAFRPDIERVAARMNPDDTILVLRTMEEALVGIARNANPQLAMEAVVLALPHVSPG